MKIKVAWIGKTKEPAIQTLTDDYLKRIARYAEVSDVTLKGEAAILADRSLDTQAKALLLGLLGRLRAPGVARP